MRTDWFFILWIMLWISHLKTLPNLMSQRFSPVSFWKFYSFSYTFRSVIHVELIFVYHAHWEFKLLFLHVIIQLFQNICWKDYPFSINLCCHVVKKLRNHDWRVSFVLPNFFAYLYVNTKLNWLFLYYTTFWNQVVFPF